MAKEFCDTTGADEAAFDECWGLFQKRMVKYAPLEQKKAVTEILRTFDQVEGYKIIKLPFLLTFNVSTLLVAIGQPESQIEQCFSAFKEELKGTQDKAVAKVAGLS